MGNSNPFSLAVPPACDDATSVSFVVTKGLKVPKERLAGADLRGRVRTLADKVGGGGLVDAGGCMPIEEGATVLARGHDHGFIAAATAAFAQHYPMAVRPQHFWLMIMQGVATHVEQNAEAVRAKWVRHKGKKTLVVRCDEFCLGSENNWASVVDGKGDSFSAQIDNHVVEGVSEALSPAFSDTTPEEHIAAKITVMDVCKSFFTYKCSTMCGFPSITMEGTIEDWRALRANAEALVTQRCTADFAKKWTAALLPLLDKFVAEYSAAALGGKAGDEKFWNSMCKRGGTSGSGASTWFNGWFNILFPFIQTRFNRYAVPYSPSNGYVKEGRNGGHYGMHAPEGVQGPDCEDFPGGLAEAPVEWDYLGKSVPLKFKAGFVGATQDRDTGLVRPAVGWFIAKAPTPEQQAAAEERRRQRGW